MTYKETLTYLYSRLPVFQRIGAAAYKPGLERTIKLLNKVNNPHNQLKCVHVAGTNGKGSTSHMLASIFMEAGYRVGLYTSPHLKEFTERISVNGKKISKPFIVEFINTYKNSIELIKPSFFEVTVAMAFSYFKYKKTDICIIEVGMGGRLDSTNVIQPELAVITNIGFDHMQFLGNTLPLIAKEKAGIIKSNTPVVIGESTPQTYPVFVKIAKEKSAPIYFTQKNGKNYKSQLTGIYQEKNKKTVALAAQLLSKKGWNIKPIHIKKGILNVVTNTHVKGRWQTLSKNPTVIVDIAHNKDGINQVLLNLKNIHYDQLHMVVGTVHDKDVDSMLKLLPKNALYYFVQAKIPRALPAKELALLAAKYRITGKSYPSVKTGIKAAQLNAQKKDVVLITGSAFVVAEAIN